MAMWSKVLFLTSSSFAPLRELEYWQENGKYLIEKRWSEINLKTLLQIFAEFAPNFKIIFKGIIGPDVTRQGKL